MPHKSTGRCDPGTSPTADCSRWWNCTAPGTRRSPPPPTSSWRWSGDSPRSITADGGVRNPPPRRAVCEQHKHGSVGAGAGNRPGYPTAEQAGGRGLAGPAVAIRLVLGVGDWDRRVVRRSPGLGAGGEGNHLAVFGGLAPRSGELGGRHHPERGVRPVLVVVLAPVLDHDLRLSEA